MAVVLAWMACLFSVDGCRFGVRRFPEVTGLHAVRYGSVYHVCVLRIYRAQIPPLLALVDVDVDCISAASSSEGFALVCGITRRTGHDLDRLDPNLPL